MSFDDFESAQDGIKDYIQSIGDEFLEENLGIQEVTHRGETFTLQGIRCRHGSNTYFVGGHPELPYFHIIFPLSIVQNIVNTLPEGFADRLSLDEVQLEGSPEERAAAKLLNEIPEGEQSDFQSYLFLMMSGGEVACSFQYLEDGALASFHIERKIYPYESDFSLRVFNDSVQSVISHGVRGANAVGQSMNVQIDEENPEESEILLSKI